MRGDDPVRRRHGGSSLGRRLAAAERGHGQFVAIVGEPRVGKSRLIWEFTRSPHVAGWLVLEAAAVPYGKTTPYLPVIYLLKAYCGIGERDDRGIIREKVTGKLLALDPAFEVALPAFLTLLDLPADDRAWAALEPPQRATADPRRSRAPPAAGEPGPAADARVRRSALDRRARHRRCSIAWSKASDQHPCSCCVNHCAKYPHAWGRKASYTRCAWTRSPAASAGDMLNALLGTIPHLGPLKQLLGRAREPVLP